MDGASLMFYFLAGAILISSLAVIITSNPIYSALSLSLTMICLGFMFFTLSAEFIAWVQLIVYAGAVMVLFVMVVMLFDIENEKDAFSKGIFTGMIKIGCAGSLCGLIAGSVYMSTEMVTTSAKGTVADFSTKAMAVDLFTKYVFAFEALGILLLIIAIGVVAVSRTKGGTHAK